MIKRQITERIKSYLFKGKAIIIYGPRQSGKTTLINQLIKEYKDTTLLVNGDEPDIRDLLNNANSAQIKSIIGKNRIFVIDEAQRISNIGLTLKLIIDNIAGVQVIASGSSSFELSEKITEPLTGRKYEFRLYPIAFAEMVAHTNLLDEKRSLHERMLYGYYPEVVTKPNESRELIKLIAGSYVFKDLILLEQTRQTELLEKLLKALAYQIGNEVSYNELAGLTGSNNKTVEKYIYLLEKAFIIFRLNAYSGNKRNEIKKSKKIFFYDNGIRNAIINDFDPIVSRQDKGQLWENFIISERIKYLAYNNIESSVYFWRTVQKQEIDLIEVLKNNISAYEFKYSSEAKYRFPLTFTNNYKAEKQKIITPDNIEEFCL